MIDLYVGGMINQWEIL